MTDKEIYGCEVYVQNNAVTPYNLPKTNDTITQSKVVEVQE